MDKSILSLINEKMQNLSRLTLVESSKDYDGDDYSSSYFEIREISKKENLYVKIHYYEDSYGDEAHITGIEFVSPTPIQKVEYKTI